MYRSKQGGGKMKEEIKVIPVIRVVCEIGDGSIESPCRTGIEYRDLDGRVLFITESDITENGEIISAEFRGRRKTQVLPRYNAQGRCRQN